MPEQNDALKVYQTPYPGVQSCVKCGDGTTIETLQQGNVFYLQCLSCGRRGKAEENTLLALIAWNEDRLQWREWEQ